MTSKKALVVAVVGLCLALPVTTALPQQRTYQRDKYGAKEYSKGSYETDSSGRTVKVDKYGQKQWSEGSLQTDKDGRTYHVDKYGAKDHSKGHYETDSSGRTVSRRQVRRQGLQQGRLPDRQGRRDR